MEFERAPHLPSKAKLSWYISRLLLDPSGTAWRATGLKGGRVAVISLPPLLDADQEQAWLAEIEARFEAHAFDPIQHHYPDEIR